MAFTGQSRKIQYPINRTLVPIQAGGDMTSPPALVPNWATLDNDEKVTITMNLSLNEFIAIASSIDVGRDIAYGIDAIEIWQIWTRAVNTMELCEQVAGCIDTSQDVKRAISQQIASGGGAVSPDGVNTVIGTDSAVFSNDNLLDGRCSDSEIMGQCVAIVEYLNTIAQDWIEAMVAYTLPAEFAGYVAQTIPLSNQLGVDYGDLIDWVSDEVLTQYVGAYDEALRNEASCLLFDRACGVCELTLDMVMEEFSQQVGININPVTAWSALIADIVTLSLGDGVVYGVWQLICATWKAQSFFTGISGIQAMAYSASKADPIDPAIIGCNPCSNEWVFTEHFDAGFGIFSLIDWGAGWSPTTRGAVGSTSFLVDTLNEYQPLDRYFRGIAIVDTFTATNIKEIEIEYSALQVGGANSAIKLYNAGIEVFSHTFVLTTTSGTPEVLTLPMDVTADEIQISLVCGFATGSPPSGSMNLDYVKFTGTGTNPF